MPKSLPTQSEIPADERSHLDGQTELLGRIIADEASFRAAMRQRYTLICQINKMDIDASFDEVIRELASGDATPTEKLQELLNAKKRA